MKVRVRASKAIQPGQSSLVVIGNFDGVHLGHRAVIEAALTEARASGLYPLVLTFDPHPAEVLGRGARPPLTVLDRKLELIERLGSELTVVVEPFTLELSQFSPEQFARKFVVELLSAKVVIVGENFRFGHRRAGDLPTLVALGQELGFAAFVSISEFGSIQRRLVGLEIVGAHRHDLSSSLRQPIEQIVALAGRVLEISAQRKQRGFIVAREQRTQA